MAATAVLGKVEEFDSSKEDWQQYVERLGHFSVANGIRNGPYFFPLSGLLHTRY